MRRKIILSKAAIFVSALFCVALIKAGAVHEHDFVYVTDIEPTCTEKGTVVYECSECGERKTEEIKALGHDFKNYWETDIEPTCDKKGEKSLHCTRCDKRDSIVQIPAKGHSFHTETISPTCTSMGYDLRTCEVCGLSREENMTPALGHKASLWIVDEEPDCERQGLRHTYCTVCGETIETLPIAPTGHQYKTATFEPTCTEKGYTLHTCLVCQSSYKDKEKKALGHDFDENGIVTKEPNCTEKGSRLLTCKVCGASEEKAVAALGHDYSSDWTIDKEATCTAMGEKSRHCTRCGARKEVTSIERISHDLVTDEAVAATCTQSGLTEGTHCTLCNRKIVKQEKIPALGHDYVTIRTISQPTCSASGQQEVRCDRCRETTVQSIAKLGHDYSPEWTTDKEATCTAMGEKSHHCVRCGARKEVTSIEKLSHKAVTDRAVAATCTQSGLTEGTHCSVCQRSIIKQEKIPALGHSYASGRVITEPTCTKAGTQEVTCTRCSSSKTQSIEKLGHDYSSAWTTDKEATCSAKGEKSHHCSRCSARKDVTTIEKADHELATDKAVEPTCTQSGLTEGSHCKVCKKVIEKQEKVAALGHDNIVTKVITEPTCTQTGLAKVVCSRCGEKSQQTTPKLGHEYSEEWTVDKVATCKAQGEMSRHCINCGKGTDIIKTEKTDHTAVKDKAVAATCTKDGKTAGSHCSVCGKVITSQKKVKATGHKEKKTVTKATTKKNGKIVVKCKICSKVVSKQAIDKIGTAALSKTVYTYDAKGHKPTVTVKDSKGKTLKNKTDYKLKYSGNGKAVGGYSITVTFKGNYEGTKTLRFSVVPKAPTKLDCTQSTNSILLTWQKVYGADGYYIYEYEPKAKSYTLKGKTTELYFSLKNLGSAEKHTYALKAFKTIDGKNYFSGFSSLKKTATKPVSPNLKASSGNGLAVLSWNNVGDCEYEIYRAEKKNGKYICVGTTRKLTFTSSPLTHGKTYYFKVKACVRDSVTTYSYSSSEIKAVAVR